MIARLNEYWGAQGCAIVQPYDIEVGAGTMHPETVLRSLGPHPASVAYVQPSRRPADGRYTLNPMRSQRYYQYQVLIKPSPTNIVDLYIGSLEVLGFDMSKNDFRLVEDDWEAPSLGASGVGWEVWLDGAEITQFTFFQQMGGIECRPVCAEITFGLERLCLLLNKQNSFWTELEWRPGLSYRTMEWEAEMQNNVYNFEVADVPMLFKQFEVYEAESKRVIETPVYWDASQGVATTTPTSDEWPTDAGPQALVYPALDLALHASHVFNLLDARGALGASERGHYINRIRARVRAACLKYVEAFAPERDQGPAKRSAA